MATSYANAGGTGDRQATIVETSSPGGLFSAGTAAKLIDGNTVSNNTFFASGVTTGKLRYQFGTPKVIDAFKWYQSNATAHGSWQWFSSSDGSSFTARGNSFSLAGPAGGGNLEITEPNGNIVAALYWEMQQVGGSTSAGPFLYEIEFKIDDAPAVTGTLAATEGSDVAAIVGNLPATGSFAVTEESDVLTFLGNLSALATLDVTESSDIVLLLGAGPPPSGTLAATEGQDVTMFNGELIDMLAVSEEPDIATFLGTVSRRPYTVVLVSQ